MTPFFRMRTWWQRLKGQVSSNVPGGLLREFVYLDDVSVYSILASRKGSIAAEFTENQTMSLNSDIGASLGIGLDATKAKFDAGLHSKHIHGSQVLRKAIIQTSFKELYEAECGSLALSASRDSRAPTVNSMADLEKRSERLSGDGWLVDPNALRRGDLFEVEVELEADPIFRMTSIITTLRELVENNERIFGKEVTAKLPEMRAMAQVLDGLLVGLVPIKGRLVKYAWASINGRDVLVHQSVVEQIKSDPRFTKHPAYLVGVAQGSLFWKDIRRLLFSRSEYTVFCRLAVSGLGNTWNPVKIAGVLEGIVPQFENVMREFSEIGENFLATPSGASPAVIGHGKQNHKGIIREYARRVIEHHEGSLDAGAIESAIGDIALDEDWWRTVDARRNVFMGLTERLDCALGVETGGEVAYRIRDEVCRDVGVSSKLNMEVLRNRRPYRAALSENSERFLDAEIIAIYW